MKRLIPFLFLFPSFLCAETLVIEKFGGLNTDDNPATLSNQTPDSQNVLTDEGPGLQTRKGFVVHSTSTCSGGTWNFPNSSGTKYLICAESGVLKASDGDGTFDILISTISSSVDTDCSPLGDKLYFVNTEDGLKYWDTSSVTVASATLTVSDIETHKGCLWATGNSSAARTIYKSAFGDGTNWTLATSPAVTDPAQFVFGGALDEQNTAIFASFQDKLMVFSNHSFGAIMGNSRADFVMRTYSNETGTAYPTTIRDCEGYLRWLGPERTVWEFDGAKYYIISKDIGDLLETVVQGDASQRVFTVTDETDFDNGTNHETSNSIDSGSVVLSTWTDTDTSGTDFGSGTLTDVTTQTVSGSLHLSTNNVNIPGYSFDPATTDWVRTNFGWNVGECGLSPKHGAYAGQSATGFTGTITVNTYDSDDTLLDTADYNATSAWQQGDIDLGSYVGRNMKIEFTFSGVSSKAKSAQYFIPSGSLMTFWYAEPCASPNDHALIDLIEGGRSDISSGTFVSQSFDTAFTSPAWLSSGANWTSNGHSISFQTQVSTDNATWDSLVAWSTGAAPTSDNDRYIRYKVTMATATAGTGLPYVEDVTLSARAKTGKYVSESIQADGMTSHGVFGVDEDLNDGTVTYGLYTDTDSTKTVTDGVPVAGTYTSSQTITNGSLPTVSTGAYVFIGADYSITAGTQNPTTNELIVRWNTGSVLDVPTTFINQRYWMGVAVSSDSNNKVLVYDKNKQWQKFSGINTDTMIIYNSNLIFGNSSGLFQAEEGYTDNGTAIASYYKTKDYSPSGPNRYSTFNDLQITAKNSANTLSTVYQVNAVDTDYSFADYPMNTQTGLQNIRFPFSWESLQQGKNINFKFSVSGSSFWRLLGATLDHKPDRVPD